MTRIFHVSQNPTTLDFYLANIFIFSWGDSDQLRVARYVIIAGWMMPS
jgi:hypothetical protein